MYHDVQNRIIKDARVLTENFIPGTMNHRDGQLKAVSDALKPLLKGMEPRNSFLFGDTGTGKTCLSNYVVEEFSAYSSHVLKAYVNCWLYPSKFKVLFSILTQFGHALEIHRKGTPTDELVDILRKRAGERPSVVILDEVDQLEDDSVLYDLVRTPRLALILVSNSEHALHGVDDRIRSSLASANRIPFPRYSQEELASILRDRASWGLVPGVVKREQLARIAEKAGGDARIALGILRAAAEDAENNDEEKITEKYIEKAIPKAERHDPTQVMDRLNSHQKILLDIIKTRGKVRPQELYSLYEKACTEKGVEPAVDRTVRKHIEKMVRYGLIKTESDNRWRVYSAP